MERQAAASAHLPGCFLLWALEIDRQLRVGVDTLTRT
jgi:hypothetical protein